MKSDVRETERPLRADAARNRAKILEAAARVFAERGLSASLDDVAEAAGVGVATVYRRFSDKDSLVVALFEDAIEDIARLAQRALEFEDSWEGFVYFVEEVLSRECANQGLRDVIIGSPYAQARMAEVKGRLKPLLTELLARAQRDGYLREDIVASDVVIFEMMISTLGGPANEVAPDLWRRYLGLLLDALVVSRDESRALPESPPEEVVLAALHASKSRRGLDRVVG